MSSSSSVRFPSTSQTLPRAPGLKRSIRVPNRKASNRHIACVGELDPNKITFCSSFENTYTTVTFKPPKRRIRLSDAVRFKSSTRLSLSVEKETVTVPEGKMKVGYKKLLRMKVQQLLQRNNSVTTTASSSSSPSESSSSSSTPPRTPTLSTANTTPNLASHAVIEPSRKGTSLFHFGRPRKLSAASKAATVTPGMGPANRSNLTLNILAPESTNTVQQPPHEQPRARVVRRSRSFDDADRSFLAAHIALDQAARELAESLNRDTRGEYAFQHFFDREVEADDEDTLCRVSDTGDHELNSLLDEVTEEALEIVEIMGQGGWVLDKNGNLVHNPQAAMYRV